MTGRARQLAALTGIRGVAAWAVVLYHIRLSLLALLPGWAIAALARGYLAVDMFFVLSGFVIWYNYADRVREGGWGEARRFGWRRFARVWPLHALILGAFVALALALRLTGRSDPGLPLGELPLHLLLLQNWGFTRELAWNHPAWSISTEMAAYLGFPFAVWAAARVPARRWGPGALVIAVCAALHALFAWHGHARLGDDIARLGLARCLGEFTLGMALCVLWRRQRESEGERGTRAAGWALALIATLALGMGLHLAETAFVPLAFFCGLMALALDQGAVARRIGAPALHYLGEISYSTYLAHALAFRVFKLAFVDASLQLGWIGLAGFLGALFAASAALYHGVEKPAQRWLNAHPPRWLEAGAAARRQTSRLS